MTRPQPSEAEDCSGRQVAVQVPTSRHWVTTGDVLEPSGTFGASRGRIEHMEELDEARYISLTTFKMDGSPVATPVWITGAEGSYAFTTGGNSWKARRMRRNPSVEVQVCGMRGRVLPDATRYVGTGQLDSSPAAVASAERALAAKYGWQFHATKFVERVMWRFGRGEGQQAVAVHLSLRAS